MNYKMLADELCRMHFERMAGFSALAGAMSAHTGEAGALIILYRLRRAALSGELVEKMGLTSGRVANILRRLEEKGLIQRQADREDGRHVLVSLTESGQRAARAQQSALLEACRDWLEFLGPEDSQALVRLTGRLLDRAGRSPAEP